MEGQGQRGKIGAVSDIYFDLMILMNYQTIFSEDIIKFYLLYTW